MSELTEIWTLSSGSSGNCCWVRHGKCEFLIDAGISRRAISTALQSLGSDLSRLSAVFVTHEHSDHVKGLPMLAKYEHLPVHAVAETADQLSGVDPACIIPHAPLFSVELSHQVKVESFVTPHDSMASVGYVITTGDRRFALATDMGMCAQSVADALTGCEGVILEANYDADMLRTGPYPLYLQDRIAARTGHLDNRDTAKMAAYLALHGTRRVLLAHLSKENNTPAKAMETVSGYLAEHHIKLDVAVADRAVPTRLI
ncbi:MAG: MBL fold metallo-hydrolase [Clostridia bacterium]|nr:MBL fold metallo-hydrolase [Clostridia bacterium]